MIWNSQQKIRNIYLTSTVTRINYLRGSLVFDENRLTCLHILAWESTQGVELTSLPGTNAVRSTRSSRITRMFASNRRARRDSLISRNAIYMKRNPQSAASGVASVSRDESRGRSMVAWNFCHGLMGCSCRRLASSQILSALLFGILH